MTPQLVTARILADSILEGASLSLSDATEVSGFPQEYALDWLDWTAFRASSVTGGSPAGTSFGFVAIIAADAEADAFGWCIDLEAPTAVGECTIELMHNDGSGWVSISTVDLLTDGTTGLKAFGAITVASADSIGLFMTDTRSGGFPSNPWDVLAIAVGNRVDTQMGQRIGLTPSAFQRLNDESSVMSVGGHLLGRDLHPSLRRGVIEQEHVTEGFIAGQWVQVLEHAQRKPVFYQWDPEGHPTDVVLAVADSLPSPSNMRPVRMRANLPWSGVRS